jgi:hypothetical protein
MNRFMDFCLQNDSTKGPHLVKRPPTPPIPSRKWRPPRPPGSPGYPKSKSPPTYSATPEPLVVEDLDSPFPEPLTHVMTPWHRTLSVTSASLSPSSRTRDHQRLRSCRNRCGFSGNDDMIEAHERICPYHHTNSQNYSDPSVALETICGTSHHLKDHEYREIKGSSSEASRCQCHICYHRFGYEPTIKAKCQNCDTALCNKCYLRTLGHTGFPEPYGSEPWLKGSLD